MYHAFPTEQSQSPRFSIFPSRLDDRHLQNWSFAPFICLLSFFCKVGNGLLHIYCLETMYLERDGNAGKRDSCVWYSSWRKRSGTRHAASTSKLPNACKEMGSDNYFSFSATNAIVIIFCIISNPNQQCFKSTTKCKK